MKKWTCCLLSAVLLTVFSVNPASNENSEDFVGFVLKKAVSFFMGIDGEKLNNDTEGVFVTVDLTKDEDFSLEIEKIKGETVIESNENELSETSDNKNRVLIYHTHTDEAYFKGDLEYTETSVGRTGDNNYNVVNVGEKLKAELEMRGFTVTHDSANNLKNGFNKAYQTSYETIKPYIGETDIYIDLHRDAYMGKEPNFLTADGNEYAYVCFVVAKGENYTDKPHWQENYKLAQKLTDKMNELCPGIAKDIVFKNTRFNQHVSDSCLLIEMGNERNSLAQVRASAEIVAEAMKETVKIT